MPEDDQPQAQPSPSATEPTDTTARLAQDLWQRHVVAPRAVSTRTALRLARRAAPATARHSPPPIRRLQRMAAANADFPPTSLPLRSALAVPSQSALQGTVSRLLDTGTYGAATADAPGQTPVRAIPPDRQVAAQTPTWGMETSQSASQARLETAIMRSHLSGPAERTIQRQVAAQDQPSARAHRALPHQTGAALARRRLDTTASTQVVPRRPAEAPTPETPPATMPAAMPVGRTIQRQAATEVASQPMPLARVASSPKTLRSDRTGPPAPAARPVVRVAARPGHPMLSRKAIAGGRSGPALSVPVSARLPDVSRATTPLVLSRMAAGAAPMIARQETASAAGAAPPPASELASSPGPAPVEATSASTSKSTDPDELVEKVLQRLMRRLAVEGERRGWMR